MSTLCGVVMYSLYSNRLCALFFQALDLLSLKITNPLRGLWIWMARSVPGFLVVSLRLIAHCFIFSLSPSSVLFLLVALCCAAVHP